MLLARRRWKVQYRWLTFQQKKGIREVIGKPKKGDGRCTTSMNLSARRKRNEAAAHTIRRRVSVICTQGNWGNYKLANASQVQKEKLMKLVRILEKQG